MQVLVSQYSGFCEGVERAFRIALENIQSGKPVYMLGNLVHNRQVVEKFTSSGTVIVKSLSEIPAQSRGILLISAHGVPPQVYEEATKLGLEIVDTTCPWVKKAQKIAQALGEESDVVIIIGDKGHAEVKGLIGWSKGKGIVVENLDDLNHLHLSGREEIGILAQTTQAEEHYKKIVAKLKEKMKNVKEFDTICGATCKRQNSATQLAKKVDLMLVIGDKMSANTKRLAELCAKTGVETHQIQSLDELEKSWLNGKEKIGITAGASTPDWVIHEVLEYLKNL